MAHMYDCTKVNLQTYIHNNTMILTIGNNWFGLGEDLKDTLKLCYKEKRERRHERNIQLMTPPIHHSSHPHTYIIHHSFINTRPCEKLELKIVTVFYTNWIQGSPVLCFHTDACYFCYFVIFVITQIPMRELK